MKPSLLDEFIFKIQNADPTLLFLALAALLWLSALPAGWAEIRRIQNRAAGKLMMKTILFLSALWLGAFGSTPRGQCAVIDKARKNFASFSRTKGKRAAA
jgi:hypothetical protein